MPCSLIFSFWNLLRYCHCLHLHWVSLNPLNIRDQNRNLLWYWLRYVVSYTFWLTSLFTSICTDSYLENRDVFSWSRSVYDLQHRHFCFSLFFYHFISWWYLSPILNYDIVICFFGSLWRWFNCYFDCYFYFSIYLYCRGEWKGHSFYSFFCYDDDDLQGCLRNFRMLTIRRLLLSVYG